VAKRNSSVENLVNFPSTSFWRGRRVLITGQTGFKGAWLSYWLNKLGAKVTGVGLSPNTYPALYDLLSIEKLISSNIVDILDIQNYKNIFDTAKPEFVFHLAAQPLVLEGYKNPVSTFATNLMGTVNTLDLIRLSPSVKCAIMITTDKVYENREWVYPYRETDRLGGYDPYSSSKAACELAIASYRRSFFNKPKSTHIASARAGNIIGGGDWSADRIIPDAIRAWGTGTTLNVRRPFATRPWQHVLDPLNAYLILAEKLWKSKELEGAYNFGPNASEFTTVKDVILKAVKVYGKGSTNFQAIEDADDPHEANTLSLDITKSKRNLNIHSAFAIDISIQQTINWYKNLSQGISARELCDSDIAMYGKLNA
jgi:CDP-glucose 4,6-dehydratase